MWGEKMAVWQRTKTRMDQRNMVEDVQRMVSTEHITRQGIYFDSITDNVRMANALR